MHRIDLVGLSHMDQNTEKRLKNAFKKLRPNVMTLEYPADQKGFQEFLQSDEWQKKLRQIEMELGRRAFDKETSQLQVDFQYASEVSVMQKLFEENDAPLFCVDDLETRKIILMRLNYAAFFEELDQEDAGAESCEDDYALFERHIYDNRIDSQMRKLMENSKKMQILSRDRETFQRDRIKEILDECPYKQIKLMHVGGLAHLADVKGYTTLYRLLKKVLPKRLFRIHRHSLRQFEEADNAV